MNLKYFLSIFLLLSCSTNTDNQTISNQIATIDSLQTELKNYKILYEVAKEVIESDSSYTE